MLVIFHNDTRVIVDVDGVVMQSEQCVDRYRFCRRWPVSEEELDVEIWELPDGGVIRLSREAQPEAGWVAQPWV
ncbi:hypothetical protein [Deinococcus apachensis]|uniref:hypothetical protein n=1 Tax=Deinococcus apachensis TaxID=309886 RepID=UPI0003717EB6|nr:hypothetical protein [Deinococcus apachensis]